MSSLLKLGMLWDFQETTEARCLVLGTIYSDFKIGGHNKDHKRSFLEARQSLAVLYSGFQAQWDRLSKQSVLTAIK